MRYFSSIFLLVFSIFHLKSQGLDLSFHHLTEENGLTSAKYYYLSDDSRNLIWIGTNDGLLQFDGQKIRPYHHDPDVKYSLSDNKITSTCFEDIMGNFWFTTQSSVNYYRRISDDFISFSIPGKLDNYHAFYLENEQKLWLRVGSGKASSLCFFDINTQQFTQSIALEGDPFSVIKNQSGEVSGLVCSSLHLQSGLIWIDLEKGINKKIDFLYTSKNRKRSFPSPTKGGLIDTDGTVWVGVYNGLGCYVPEFDKSWVEEERNDAIDEDIGWVNNIIEFGENQLLLAADHGLFLFDKRSKMIIRQIDLGNDFDFGLKLKDINNLHLDQQNNLWLSSSKQEIAFAHFDKKRFPDIVQTRGHFIINISEDSEGRIWCSTLESGVFVFNQNREFLFHCKTLRNEAVQGKVSKLPRIGFFLTDTYDSWWGIVGNNLLAWDEESQEFVFKRSYFLGVNSSNLDRINYSYRLSNNKNLIAQRSNIYELVLNNEKVDTLPWHNLQFLHLGIITTIFQDKEELIYLGDDRGRLVIIREQNDQIVKIADINTGGVVHHFEEDIERDVIWIASAKGLGRLDKATFEYSLLEEQMNGIPTESFYHIIIDLKQNLWLPGNKGLVRYNPNTLSFHRFKISDGLLSSVFGKNTTLCASQSKEIWVGGKNGVNVFIPENVHLLSVKPNIRITGLMINDEEYPLEKDLNEKRQLQLKHFQNTLSFQFAALDYSDPDANQFYYQMVGYDVEPVFIEDHGFVRFTNLPHGSYVFKVWGTNSDGILNETPLTIDLTIKPAFYQTWWFYLLCLLIISTLIYLFFQYRLEQALKIERVRVKISSDLHDDVGGILSGLAMQSELLALNASTEFKPKLDRIAELSRKAMYRMRDTVWAIDTRKNKLEDLIDRIHEHAEETLDGQKMQYEIIIKNLDLKTKMPSDVRQNIYLICKEAITNAAKHSNGNHVSVSLKKSKHHFVMTIHDNGNTKVQNHKPSGIGLSNINRRAEQLGATLQLSDEDGYKIVLSAKKLKSNLS